MINSYIIELTPIVSLAMEVLAGKYGTGEERKKKLEELGYDYNKIQSCVNDLVEIGKKYA